jgi:flagellar hook capping protein FlgD
VKPELRVPERRRLACIHAALRRAARAGGVTLALSLAASVPAARAGVTTALLPATQTVAPGSEFDLYITITPAGSAFNAFDAVIGFDPAALTLLQLSPLSLQEGALMTSACSSTFHRFTPGSDRVTIADVLLCDGQSVTGPGQIYRLHFRAANTPQSTTVRFLPGLHFYDAGLYVTPVTSSDASVGIGVMVGVGDAAAAAPGLRILALPNPAHTAATLRVEADRAGPQEVRVLDALGRVVRRIERGSFAAGPREIAWNRRSDAGRRLPSGLYTVEVTSGAQSARARLVLLP